VGQGLGAGQRRLTAAAAARTTIIHP
jgi:hypothetical protein